MKTNENRKVQLNAVLMRMVSYYQQEVHPDVIELYHQALAAYPTEAIKRACGEHIKTCKWFPKICELVDILKTHTPALESIADQQAGIVLNHIRRYGYTSLPVWEDPITDRLFSQRFSYSELCNSLTEKETKWFVKEFKEAYQAAHDVCGGDTLRLEAPEKNVMALIENIGT